MICCRLFPISHGKAAFIDCLSNLTRTGVWIAFSRDFEAKLMEVEIDASLLVKRVRPDLNVSVREISFLLRHCECIRFWLEHQTCPYER